MGIATKISKEGNFYWLELGGSAMKISLEKLYELVLESKNRKFIFFNNVKEDLGKYASENNLEDIF